MVAGRSGPRERRKDRPAALPVLVGMHRDVSGADMDAETKARLLADLDTTLLDIVRTDVLNAPNRSFMDRILQLMKLCAASPLAGRQGAGLCCGSGGPRGQQPGIPGAVHETVQGGSGTQTSAAVAAQSAEDIGAGIAVILKGDKFALIVMPRLDLGISRRKATIPAPERLGEEWVPQRN